MGLAVGDVVVGARNPGESDPTDRSDDPETVIALAGIELIRE